MSEISALRKRLNSTIDTLIKRQYIQKFIGFKNQISLKSVYDFFRKQGIKSYLKDDTERINNKYKQLYFRVKNNKYIKELQKKYPKLKVVETYTFLVMENYFKLTKNDVKNFEIAIYIFFSKTNVIENKKVKKQLKELKISFE